MAITNPDRTCPWCGKPFTATSGRQVFCTTEHQVAFHALSRQRGQIIMPLLYVARAAGRYKDTDKDLGAYARTQADGLISLWLVEDRKAGRRADAMVSAKMEAAWRAPDALSSSFPK